MEETFTSKSLSFCLLGLTKEGPCTEVHAAAEDRRHIVQHDVS
jgi:hypothetical protein